jgi:hypothetical protein
MKLKTIAGIVLLSASTASNAAFNMLTCHARANCAGVNESICWDMTGNWMLKTRSVHQPLDRRIARCDITTGWEYTRRNAVVHWVESQRIRYQFVEGSHWLMNQNKRVILIGYELVSDCSIYNGWWDHEL